MEAIDSTDAYSHEFSFDANGQLGETTGDPEDDYEFEVLVQTYLHDAHYTSKTQAIYNIVYAILNGGIVALPYAASEAGIVLFIFAILLTSVISGYTSYIVISMANQQGVRTLEDLGQRSFGPKGLFVVSILQIVFSLSLMCISLDIWGDIASSVLANRLHSNDKITHPLLMRRESMILFGGLLVLPLCVLTRSMVSLRYTSYLTVIVIFSSILAVIGAYVSDAVDKDSFTVTAAVAYPRNHWFLFSFIITFCFSFNQKVFSVYSCLRRRSADRWKFSVVRAVSIITALYLFFGIFGYMSCEGGSFDKMNYFLDWQSSPRNRKLVLFDILRCIVACSLLLTVPADCLVATSTLRRLYRRLQRMLNRHTHSRSFRHRPSSGQTASTVDGYRHRVATGSRANVWESAADGPMSPATPRLFRDEFPCLWSCCCICTLCGCRLCDLWHDKTSDYGSGSSNNTTAHTNHNHNNYGGKKAMRNSELEWEAGWEFDPNDVLSGGGGSSLTAGTDTCTGTGSHSLLRGGDSCLASSSVAQQADKLSMISQLNTDMKRGGDESNDEQQEEGNRVTVGGDVSVDHKASSHSVTNEAVNLTGRDSDPCQSAPLLADSSEHTLEEPFIRKRSIESLVDLETGGVPNQHQRQSVASTAYEEEKEILITDFDDISTMSGYAGRHDGDGSPRAGGGRKAKRPHGAGRRGQSRDRIVQSRSGRQSSLGYMMQHSSSSCSAPALADCVPGLFFWSVAVAICFFDNHGAMLAATVGALATAVLVYILPTMIYFRLGLATDYSAIPWRCMGGIVPNRAFMFVVQVMGLMLLVFNLAVIGYCLYADKDIVT